LQFLAHDFDALPLRPRIVEHIPDLGDRLVAHLRDQARVRILEPVD
jgi:hypothetical protein